MSDQIPLQDTYRLKHLFQVLKDAFFDLSQSTYADASKGYSAVVHTMAPSALHPDERLCYPWNPERLTLISQYPAHEQAILGIQDIIFHDLADPRRTFDYPGLILCSPDTLECVDAVNTAKEEFKDEVLAVKSRYRELTDQDIEQELQFREGEWSSLESFKKTSKKAGLGRICIKQVYRKIPTIRDYTLKRAKYYHNRKRPSRPRTVAAQLEKFNKLVDKGRAYQAVIEAIEILSQMDPNQLITERQDSNEVITVNYKIFNPTLLKNKNKWSQVTGVLPVYCLGDPTWEIDKLVDFKSLDKDYSERNNSKETGGRKGQISWSEQPFLPAFRLYLPIK